MPQNKGLLLLLMICSFMGVEAQQLNTLLPRRPADKTSFAPVPPETEVESVVIKFQEGSRVRLRGQSLVVLARSPREVERLSSLGLTGEQVQADLHATQALVASHKLVMGRGLERLFSVGETDLAARRASGEARSGRELADLDLYYQLRVPAGTRYVELEELLASLNSLASVEIAYAKPPVVPVMDIPPATPSFESSQGYLDPAPFGIDARYAWTVSGGKGQGVRIVDVEGAWNLAHEDLPALFHLPISQTSAPGDRAHGTAVLGEMIAPDNGYGVTGIAHEARGGAESYYNQGEAAAILNAAAAAGPGGLVLLEMQSPGPATPNSPCNCSSCCDCVPVEYFSGNFEAIAQATANGAIVVEAAANGATDLDDPVYSGRFDRAVRDSGAILVGASNSADRAPTCFSNYGSRIDVHGWGWDVTTLGYGNLSQVFGDDNQDYTSSFSGTSSASPIVAGAGAVLQGVALASGLGYLDSFEIRQILRTTGTPQAPDARQIGPLPDLRAAIDYLFPPSAEFTFGCTGRICSFDGGASTDNAGVSSWSWSFGDGTFGSGASVSHNYATNGTRSVALTVSDAAGRTGSRAWNVTATDNPPVAGLTVACTGRICSANGSASSDDFGITDFEWTWGDGQVTHTSTSATSHTYPVNGTYGVVLKVSDTIGQTDTEGPMNVAAVDNPPIAQLTVTCSGLYCEGSSGASTDDFPGLTFGFSWTGGTPGSYLSDPTRIHSYSIPGPYTVVLIARDSIGQTTMISLMINVHGTTAAETVGVDKAGNEAKLRLYHESGSGSPIKVVLTGITGRGIAGDWNGDHVSSMGRYVASTATFYLRNTNTGGTADLAFNFGTAGANRVPIAGDWNNDGMDTVGLYDSSTGTFLLRNANSTGSADVTATFTGAASSWLPVAGDWNCDGIDTVGLYDPATSTFYLRNSNTTGGADLTFVFGTPGAGLLPNVGDWNGDGWDSIGVFDPVAGTHSLRNLNNAGPADHQLIFSTSTTNLPLAGDWDGV
jgi:serine protease